MSGRRKPSPLGLVLMLGETLTLAEALRLGEPAEAPTEADPARDPVRCTTMGIPDAEIARRDALRRHKARARVRRRKARKRARRKKHGWR